MFTFINIKHLMTNLKTCQICEKAPLRLLRTYRFAKTLALADAHTKNEPLN